MKHHDNFCFAGEDISKGSLLIKSWTKLTAAYIGVLASMGFDTVSVYRKPNIVITSTGNELIAPGSPLTAGKIYNSNLYLLASRLKELRYQCEIVSILGDDVKAASDKLEVYIGKADLILTCSKNYWHSLNCSKILITCKNTIKRVKWYRCSNCRYRRML